MNMQTERRKWTKGKSKQVESDRERKCETVVQI